MIVCLYPVDEPWQEDQPRQMAEPGEPRKWFPFVYLAGDEKCYQCSYEDGNAFNRGDEYETANQLREIQQPAPKADRRTFAANIPDHIDRIEEQIHMSSLAIYYSRSTKLPG